MIQIHPVLAVPVLLTIVLNTGCKHRQERSAAEQPPVKESTGRAEYTPVDVNSLPQDVYFGDSHVHTAYSTDARFLGATIGPDAAYRFAKGETVTASTGEQARLRKPLDWIVIADHSEQLGLMQLISEGSPLIMEHPWGKPFAEAVMAGDMQKAIEMFVKVKHSGVDPLDSDPRILRSMWDRLMEHASRHNEPGRFTALLGYEWTSMPDDNNLHRVVIYADDEDKVSSVLPTHNILSSDPEDLWRWMENYEKSTGGRVLAAAHNGNLSNGLMFDDVTLSGKPLTRDYAERRARWEPLYEVTQMKGDGETHPFLSPDDDFADYETWDVGNFSDDKKTDDMLRREYAREALKTGLKYENTLGVNPFKFGLIGASDTHTALATTDEDNFWGKASKLEPGQWPERWDDLLTGLMTGPNSDIKRLRGIHTSASGLQGVWARENTRQALFDAMAKKETYATTGTRIRVRIFGGWDFSESDIEAADFAERGYAAGVAMGGDLSEAGNRTPRLMIKAMKDPDGANLDRVQVVKGWMDADGELHEQVIDVACAPGTQGERSVAGGGCSKVGSTVSIADASYTNTIGATQLQALWEDAEFDPAQRAFYYVRVLEIPTPRWSTYDAKRMDMPLHDDVPAEQQDRAYTSPIWYTP